MADLTKSFNEIFNERISSPFYGSFIVSWILWNWKIPYVTFFVDGDRLTGNKIEYILENCNSIWNLFLFPLISTILILALLPYVTNYAYYITLKFDHWRIAKKNEVEGKRLLTMEESMLLRLEMRNLQEKYAIMLTDKDKEINVLQQQLAENQKMQNKKVKSIDSKAKDLLTEKEEFEQFMRSKNHDQFDIVMTELVSGWGIQRLDKDTSKLFIAFGILEFDGKTYKITDKGNRFYQEYSKRSLQLQ